MRRYLYLFFAVFMSFQLLGCTETIEPGNVGVVVDWGQTQPWTYPEGFHYVSPWFDIHEMSTRTRTYSMGGQTQTRDDGTQPEPAVEALTHDQLRVQLAVDVQYHLNPNAAAQVFRMYGENYDDTVVHQQVRTAVRDAASEFTAVNLVQQREQLQTRMETLVGSSLRRTLAARGVREDAVVIENILLRNIDLPDSIDEAIAQVQRQTQETERARQALATATAEANRLREQARGEADARIARAEAEARANELLTRSLTREIIEMRRIEAWQQAVANSGSRLIILPQGGTGSTNLLMQLPSQ